MSHPYPQFPIDFTQYHSTNPLTLQYLLSTKPYPNLEIPFPIPDLSNANIANLTLTPSQQALLSILSIPTNSITITISPSNKLNQSTKYTDFYNYSITYDTDQLHPRYAHDARELLGAVIDPHMEFLAETIKVTSRIKPSLIVMRELMAIQVPNCLVKVLPPDDPNQWIIDTEELEDEEIESEPTVNTESVPNDTSQRRYRTRSRRAGKGRWRNQGEEGSSGLPEMKK